MPPRILIAGAGIGGPVLAWWLHHYGFTPTLIERAPALRTGGSVIDFWGGAWDVIERMGLSETLHRADYEIDEVRLINARGRRVAGFDGTIFRRLAGGRIASLLRGELSEICCRALDGRVPIHYGLGIETLEQDASGVTVTFSTGATERFDLVIGADGLHSPTRRAALGPDPSFEHDLGYRAAVWIVPAYPHRDENAFLSFCVPGGHLGRWSLRDHRTAFFAVYVDPTGAEPAVTALPRLFTHAGWECDEILTTLANADNVYCDNVSQTRLPAWSRGRVALIGDAAYSPSLLAGQGSGLATIGAYVLAGELLRAHGDYPAAFSAYERTLRPLITARQKSALGYAGWFAPRTALGVAARRWGTALLSAPPLMAWLTRRMLDDKFTLPDYAAFRTSESGPPTAATRASSGPCSTAGS